MIARRYARALFELARERNQADVVGDELLRAAASVHDSQELRQAVSNPVFPLSQRKAALLAVLKGMGLSATTCTGVALVLERGRLGALDLIAREFQALADNQLGRIRAEVVSAQPLSPATAKSLGLALQQSTGKQVVLEQRLDPAILGGMTVKVGSTLYDGSVRSRLEELRERLVGRE